MQDKRLAIRTRAGRGGLQIGALAQHTSVNIETIRYYERSGLIPAPARTQSGRRVYEAEDVRRLAFIRRGRELGFSLANIREMLRLADETDIDCATIRELTVRHLAEVRGKIESLKSLERALRPLTDACASGEQRACPILDALTGAE